MSIVIYGASDDLVEVEGDIEEEFSAFGDEDGNVIVATSTGVVVRVVYDHEGIWRITPLVGAEKVAITYCWHDGDDNNYSDRCEVADTVDWVVFGTRIARNRQVGRK